MGKNIHITSGDMAGGILENSTVMGDVFVWHDILYDGPRNVGWPDAENLKKRTSFLVDTTGGGLSADEIHSTLSGQYDKLRSLSRYEEITLWFDACLFDQSMLVHILNCLSIIDIFDVHLICVGEFSGIEPFNGLGQLNSGQMASLFDGRKKVLKEEFEFAGKVDRSFALQDVKLFKEISGEVEAPLPFVPAAVSRWLLEIPGNESCLGRLEQLALEAIQTGCKTPHEIYHAVAKADVVPQYWGDITLWQKINDLAERQPPLVHIDGPEPQLPQWQGQKDLKRFSITPTDIVNE